MSITGEVAHHYFTGPGKGDGRVWLAALLYLSTREADTRAGLG